MSEEGPDSGIQSRAHEVFLRFLRARERDAQLELEGWLASPEASEVEAPVAADVRAMESVRRALDQALARRDASGADEGVRGDGAGRSLVRGARLGDFVLEARIGAGAMGEVWQATQVSLKRSVALKFLRRGALDEQRLEFFAREARAGARLTHAGIVAVYGTGEEGPLRWIAMELVPGGRTLGDRLRELRAQGELPDGHHEQAARILVELADALAAAHELGVIHRDLKPGNILLDQAGRPKIGDFGLAKIVDELSISRAGEMAGTYAYMSPEQISAKAVRIDRRTDVFSLGVVFYELLTLAKPFGGDTPEQVKLKICLQQPPDPRALRSRLPADLATIALKCLEKDPARRYASMRALGDDVRRFLRHEPIVARAPGRLRRAELWARRNPTISAVLAVVALALVAVSWLFARAVQREARLLELGNLRQVRVLIEEAERSWPAVPEHIPAYESWLARAESLVQDLERHRRTQSELEARARPRTDEEARVESEVHPEHARLVALRAELDVLERADEARSASASITAAETPDPRAALYESLLDPVSLLFVAESWALPNRREFGNEALALTLARRSFERLPEDLRREARITIAWALHELGRDAEAEEEARAALSEPPCRSEVCELYAKLLDVSIARVRNPDGGAGVHQPIADLEREAARLAALVSARRIWTFDDADDAWLHEGISTLVRELEAFADPARGSIEGFTAEHGLGVRKRLERARTIVHRSLEEPAERWREAVLAIADRECTPGYGGLSLSPQLGLVPLGPDPESGLWEFVDVESGVEPHRDERGRIVPTPEMGVVFVLIPGGTAVLGIQNADPDAPRYDPSAPHNQVFVQRVELDPYFLSKYELTQAQWERLTGANPSERPTGGVLGGGKRVTAVHPVEFVSWSACAQVLERQGWCLPTEAQWEHATRAGTDTRWWTGDDPRSLAGAANLSDATVCRKFPANPQVSCEDWLDDGWLYHSPVGSFRPNGFGLFDVIGNVLEWCRDGRDIMWRPLRNGDGEIQAPDVPTRTLRGGCCLGCTSAQAASWYYYSFPQTAVDETIGVRPARALQR